jgi:hypothetical protein
VKDKVPHPYKTVHKMINHIYTGYKKNNRWQIEQCTFEYFKLRVEVLKEMSVQAVAV